jgi:hypothetical protein
VGRIARIALEPVPPAPCAAVAVPVTALEVLVLRLAVRSRQVLGGHGRQGRPDVPARGAMAGLTAVLLLTAVLAVRHHRVMRGQGHGGTLRPDGLAPPLAPLLALQVAVLPVLVLWLGARVLRLGARVLWLGAPVLWLGAPVLRLAARVLRLAARVLRVSDVPGRIGLTLPAIAGGPRVLVPPPLIAPTLARALVSGRLLVVDRPR